MNRNEPGDALERLLHRTLADLPLRRAPPTLEARVLDELGRRAALPWWHSSFAHWPPFARAALLVLCAAAIGLALRGGATAAAAVRSLSWARDAQLLFGTGGNLAASLLHTAPPAWFYDGIAVCGVLYAVLFGLGAALYRTLYLQPHNGR